MSATILVERSVREPPVNHTLSGHLEALRQYIVDILSREGVALDREALDDLSESVLAAAVRMAVRWVEEER
jgi:hypothetical protein